MSTAPPTLEHYKLETEFHEGYVVNRTYEWDYSVRREKSLQEWKRGRTLGKGGFGLVWLEEDKNTGELRAVKSLERNSAVLIDAGVTRELLALITLTAHKHLFVELYGWFENASNVFIAMEYMKEGDLSEYIQDQEKSRTGAKAITKQILEGLKVIHENGICHRDLKPQNVLIASLDPIWVKLADFGASKQTKNTALRTRCGTQGYLAPELLGLLPRHLRAGSKQEFSYAIDMWSLGCLLHEMLTSQTPFLQTPDLFTDFTASDFMPETNVETLFDYCQGDVTLPVDTLQDSGVSANGISLIQHLLKANPTERPSALRTLQHSWLAVVDLENTTEVKSRPHQALGTPTAPSFVVTEDQCFNYLTRFIDKEKPTLRIFYTNEELRTLAPVAKTMVESLCVVGCKKEVAMQLSILVLYDLVLFIDDSDSMVYEENGQRIKTVKRTINEIATIYDLARPQGIRSIKFFNAPQGKKNVNRKTCNTSLRGHNFGGLTRVGTVLQKSILDKFVFGEQMKKPLLIMTVTDGEAEGERSDMLEQVLENCIKKLGHDSTRGPDAVAFGFSLVGNDTRARAGYERLRDRFDVGRHIDTLGMDLSLEQLSEPQARYRWIIMPKLLLGPIMSQWRDIKDDFDTVF